jgi:photosystem II stability/assembly factor-like uncharacterized protein
MKTPYCRLMATTVVVGLSLALTGLARGAEPKRDMGKWSATTLPADFRAQNAGFLAADRVNGDVYFNAFGGGLWKISAGGKTITRQGDKKVFPDNVMSGAVAINPDAKKMVVFGFSEGGPIPPNSCASSLDGGKTWDAMTLTNCPAGFTYAAAEPGDGKALLAQGGKLFYSPDLGKTWTDLNKKRDGVTGLGVFSPTDLVIAMGNGILHSADAGKTWAQVFDKGGCGGPVLIVKNAGYWVSPKGLIVTRDNGKTWTAQGVEPPSPPLAAFPAVLGTDENHFFILTKDGLTETRDAGKTWKVLTPLPLAWKEYSGELVSLVFDPVHNLFYIAYHWHAHHGVMQYQWVE